MFQNSPNRSRISRACPTPYVRVACRDRWPEPDRRGRREPDRGRHVRLVRAERVQILGCLLDGPLAVGEITALLGMEQSAVSHQLRVLREAELVRVERDGKRRVYTLSGDAVRELLTAARHLAGQGQPASPRRRKADAAGG